MTNQLISFQLYSARNFPPLERQLETLAAIGYDAVEPYGDNTRDDPARFRRMAEGLGLQVASAHLPLGLLEGETDRFFETAQTLGVQVAALPYLDAAERPQSAAAWKAFGERLETYAERAAGAGFALAWHNHDFEYVRLDDGSRPIDQLLAGPRLRFEADLGWMVRAGVDVAAEAGRYGARMAALHIKDLAPKGVTQDDGWTDVGAGTVDWPGLWPALSRTAAGILVVEHDNPSDWKGFATNSFRYVSRMIGRG